MGKRGKPRSDDSNQDQDGINRKKEVDNVQNKAHRMLSL
jgi:hypothetical protein